MVAKQKYLSLAPVPGKFYVSESWKSEDMGGDGIRSQLQHGNELAQLLLAGPFDIRNEAETWNTNNAKGHAEIWQF
jgi:hypothetical protein